ncbi:MAG: nucleoside/nucleotide kinase family protein [Patescibacteria group bacterium]
MPKLILGFVGPLASGKEAAKKYLEEKYGASGHRFSTMLRDILKRIYLPINRNNMQDLSLALRNCFGSDTLARVIAEDVKNDTTEIVVVDGIRRMDDIVNLKNVEGFYLIGIEAKEEIRYERMKKRNENAGDDKKTFTDFINDGKKEAELEIPTVMSNARFTINNDGSFDDLYKQINEIIIKLEK